MSSDRLIIAFMPSLVSIHWRREKEKGSPLTEQEVLALRDSAVTVALPVESAAAVEEGRGYRDIDGDHCWDEWQQMRLAIVEHEKSKT